MGSRVAACHPSDDSLCWRSGPRPRPIRVIEWPLGPPPADRRLLTGGPGLPTYRFGIPAAAAWGQEAGPWQAPRPVRKIKNFNFPARPAARRTGTGDRLPRQPSPGDPNPGSVPAAEAAFAVDDLAGDPDRLVG